MMVRVDETSAVHSPDSPNPMTVVDHFRPGTPGSTADGASDGHLRDDDRRRRHYEDYDFGSATDTDSGIIAGNDIDITAYPARETISVSGYAHLGGKLTITTARGSLTTR